MKINHPVTGQEHVLPEGASLVSKTDTRGIITFANDAFVAASGFSRQELLGANHNIIRHPDVPPAVFATMWAALKRGLPWRGVLKNRCRDGGHYWVDATVVPIRKRGETIGYMSVRGVPTRAAIGEAETEFQRIAAAPGTPRRPPAATPWRRYFSVRNGVVMGLVFVTLLLIAGGLLGITGLQRSNGALATLFGDRFEPARQLGRINLLMADNRAQIALALHHAPSAGVAAATDHALATHLENIERNRAEIEALWADYIGHLGDGEERTLAETYWQARGRYLEEGLLPARRALAAGDFAAAEALLLGHVNPRYDEANRRADQLQKYLAERARGDFTQVTRRNEQITVLAISGITFGSLLLMLAGGYFFRATVMPLERAVGALENIAQGNLSDAIDDDAFGEPGRVIAAVTVMRMHLKVMLDEIRQCSGSIHTQCRELNATMMNLAEHSDEQHDRVHQTLDTLVESCAGLAALTAQAESLHGALETHADNAPAPPPPLADDLASAARVQRFAVENVAGELRQVALLIVDNREDVQGAWSASQRLEQTAGELEQLVKYFE